MEKTNKKGDEVVDFELGQPSNGIQKLYIQANT
jgi:hypothetical protein